MKSSSRILAVVIFVLLALAGAAAQNSDDQELLRVRENVWRAWFAGDSQTLQKLVPPETIAVSGSEKNWMHQADILREAEDFHAQGGKLLRLEFTRNEVQHFGNVAIVWSDYLLETETGGQHSSINGRATEIFVRKDGQWTNPGWNTHSLK
jgi:ketosteroid isomerase-like protein